MIWFSILYSSIHELFSAIYKSYLIYLHKITNTFVVAELSKHNKRCTRARKSAGVVEMDIEDYGLIVNRGTTSRSKKNIRLKKGGSSTSEMASIRVAKKRNAASLRTEHGV